MLPYYSSKSKTYKDIRYRINKQQIILNAKKWKKSNPEKAKESSRKYNQKQTSVEYRKNYYLENKDQIKNNCKVYYENNKDRLQAEKHSYYLKNKELLIPKYKKYYQFWKTHNRYNTIFHYSNGAMCCSDCGQNIFELLTIDHINGGGNKHRKQIGSKNFYVWLRRNNYPEGYQVLCYNCNLVKPRVTEERYQEIIKELRQNILGIRITEDQR